MALTALAPCQSVIAAEVNKHSVGYFSDYVNELIDTYDSDEEYVSESESSQKTIKDRLIVSSDKVSNDYGAADKVVGLGYTILQYDSEESAETAKDSLIADGFNAEYDSVISGADVNSTESTSQTWGNDRIESKETLNVIKSSGKKLSEVTVGVIDSGVDYTHPDLKDRIVDTSLNFSSSGKTDNSMDDNGHGTMVAGIVMQNTTDNVKIKPYKVLNKDGKCATSQIISVVNHILTEKDAPSVINLSLGGEYDKLDPFEKTLRSLIESLVGKGCTVIVAAGNESSDAGNFSPSNISSVITVSASTSNNEKSYYSNFGSVIDIAAPGDNIYTTNLGGGYTSSYSGTSFAAPFVTAAAATVLMLDNTLTSKEVENKIKDAAFPIVNNTGTEWCGAGILNYSALYDDILAPAPAFSHESGAYNDIINLTASAEEGYTIRYTTDNTVPTLNNGETFNGSITINDSMSFVAVAVNESGKSKYIPLSYSVIYLADENDFEITDAGAITAYNGEKKSITVPETIKGITPTSVANKAFANSDIKVIELPETIKTIGNSSFNRCTNLTSITATGVTKIGTFCFYCDTALTDVDMPNVLFVNSHCFSGCKKLEAVNFNEVVEELYPGAFEDTAFKYAYFPKVYNFQDTFENTPLISADLPLLYWASGTFKNCYSLEHLYAPELEQLGGSAFGNCIKLTEFVKDGEYDLTKINVVESSAFADSYFKEIELPLLEAFDANGSGAFQRCHAEYISLPLIKILPSYTFYQCKELKHINMPNYVETLRDPYENIFTDCYSLEELYLPNAIYLPAITDTENTDKMSLQFIYAPNAEEFIGKVSIALRYCSNLKWAFLPNVQYIPSLPRNGSATIYISDKLEKINDIPSNDLTIIAPQNSYAESFAKEKSINFIPSDSRDESIESPANVTHLGRSIRITDAGLRFGFSWNKIPEIENLASDIEYGFVYSLNPDAELKSENADGKTIYNMSAPNRIDHGDNKTFNLVFTDIPKAAYDKTIYARAYVCIDGMYFYSNTMGGSFNEVANLVLADDEIDQNTKNSIKNLLDAAI